jgi:hypothetical protein
VVATCGEGADAGGRNRSIGQYIFGIHDPEGGPHNEFMLDLPPH